MHSKRQTAAHIYIYIDNY